MGSSNNRARSTSLLFCSFKILGDPNNLFFFLGPNPPFVFDQASHLANRQMKPVIFRQDTHAPNIGGYQTTDLYLFLVTQNEMVKAIVAKGGFDSARPKQKWMV